MYWGCSWRVEALVTMLTPTCSLRAQYQLLAECRKSKDWPALRQRWRQALWSYLGQSSLPVSRQPFTSQTLPCLGWYRQDSDWLPRDCQGGMLSRTPAAAAPQNCSQMIWVGAGHGHGRCRGARREEQPGPAKDRSWCWCWPSRGLCAHLVAPRFCWTRSFPVLASNHLISKLWKTSIFTVFSPVSQPQRRNAPRKPSYAGDAAVQPTPWKGGRHGKTSKKTWMVRMRGEGGGPEKGSAPMGTQLPSPVRAVKELPVRIPSHRQDLNASCESWPRPPLGSGRLRQVWAASPIYLSFPEIPAAIQAPQKARVMSPPLRAEAASSDLGPLHHAVQKHARIAATNLRTFRGQSHSWSPAAPPDWWLMPLPPILLNKDLWCCEALVLSGS